MKATYRNLMSLLLLTSAAVGMTSCSYDSSDEVAATPRSNDWTLNIRTTSVGDGVTRAATAITNQYDSDDKLSVTEAEKTMQNLTIGLFKSGGATLDIKDVSIGSGGEVIVNGSTSKSITTTYASNAANKSEAGDLVRLAINMPASVQTALKQKTGDAWDKDDLTKFKNTELTIDQALNPAGDGTVNPANLPMTGNGTMTFNTAQDQFVSDITVHHLVAKVTMASLQVNFTGTTHTAATFKPTEFFLTGVPEKLSLDMSDGTYAFTPTISNYYQGESTNSTNQKDFLGTGTGITEKTMSMTNDETKTYGTQYTLYTMPNNQTTTNRTYLVIKGTYSSDGQAWNNHTAYYMVPLGAKTESMVKPNVHYVVNATIKGDGAASVNDAHPSTQDIDVTVTATDFDDETVTATYTNSGTISYDPLEAPKVGDYFYADGTWSTNYETTHGAVVGLVFSTDPSDIDAAEGYTHGYVLALNNCGSADAKYAWRNAATDTGIADQDDYNGTGLPFKAKINITTQAEQIAAIKADLDGRVRSHLVSQVTGYDATTFPAFYAAENYTPVPLKTRINNSGWYLPSIGQQWALCNNFCNKTITWPDVTETWRNDYKDFYYVNKADATTNALNAYLTQRLKTDVEAAGGTAVTYTPFQLRTSSVSVLYWSSTEYSAQYAFHLNFDTHDNLYFSASTSKTGTWFVRPVLAF